MLPNRPVDRICAVVLKLGIRSADTQGNHLRHRCVSTPSAWTSFTAEPNDEP